MIIDINWFKKVLSHPLVLLIAGAIISSLVIPYYTHQWQDHQKELELKTDLTDQINKAISDTISMSYNNLNPYITSQTIGWKEKWYDELRDYLTSTEIIGSRIDSYFSNDQMIKNWNNLSSAVYALHEITTPIYKDNNHDYYKCYRLNYLIQLHNLYPEDNPFDIDPNVLKLYHCNMHTSILPYLKVKLQFKSHLNNDSIEWNAIFNREDYYGTQSTSNHDKFLQSFDILKKDIKDQKDNLLKTIYKTTITAFD